MRQNSLAGWLPHGMQAYDATSASAALEVHGRSEAAEQYHPGWQPGQAQIAANGGADRRSAKNADAPMNQSREAHRSAWPLHSPFVGHDQR
jgi:hypothetical protein